MKKMVRNLLIISTMMILSSAALMAQQLGTTGLYQHGSNSSGTTTVENTDSVTLGAQLDYYVQPDPAISPSYVYTSPLANLNSTFAWTAAPVASATITSPKNASVLTNWVSVHWTALGAASLSVVETASTGTCPGSTKTIAARVINIPTFTGGAAPAAQCASTPAGLIFAVPFTLSSDLNLPSTVRVNYTVYNPTGTTLIAAQDVELAKAATSINITLPAGAVLYGNYKVTFNTVSDRISRKSSIAGIVSTPDVLLTVNPVPTTGPIYHLPNM